MRYPTHLKVLDAFGVLAFASTVLFALMPDSFRPSSHIDDSWGGISAEMLGIWVGVRFIEWMISAHQSATKARVRVVRNMRFIEKLSHTLIEYRRSFELRLLIRETNWCRERLKSRKKYLSADEVKDVETFFAIVDEMIAMLPSPCPPPGTALTFEHDQALTICFERLGAALRNAELNILEETDEDSGM